MEHEVAPNQAFIALGANLGDRERSFRTALAELDTDGIRVVRVSSFHETQPVGGPTGQPMFLNAAAELATTIAPLALLARLLEIERRHGRVRTVADGPRTLDLDLLIYGDLRIDTPVLTLPHPRMWQRAFVLGPLAEICDVSRLAARFGRLA